MKDLQKQARKAKTVVRKPSTNVSSEPGVNTNDTVTTTTQNERTLNRIKELAGI